MAEQILVTTEVLNKTSEEFSGLGKTVAEQTREMMTIVERLAKAWEGEASQAYYQKFKGLSDDIERINKMIQEHVKDLSTISSAYASVETENMQDIASLSSDVIV